MRFKDLYDLVEREFQQPPVNFDRLRELINGYHPSVGRVELYAVKFEEQNHQAHYRLVGYDRSSAYDEEFIVAQIRYCEGLDEHPRARRFALTKELMHVFDSEETMTNTREKFFELLKEIQDRPLPEHRTGAFNTELDSRWMAAIILCPKHLRDQYVEEFKSGDLQPFEIAEAFRIPEWVVPILMGDYYDIVFDKLVK
ncbi:hypothetical protein IWQ55_006406 [Labrenzia sp. EL_208]|nr:hypothetical protein [Labrenzia sp. EL_132]MBG6233171.1 hypothetical protein [Labrenzia sp. EL_208]